MTKIRFLLLTLLLITLPAALCANDYILVVNKNNPITSLEESTVRKMFLGKKNFWDDGHRIEIFLQEDNQLHKSFTTEVLKKSTRQFKMYWRRALYSGTGLPPQRKPDDHAIKAEIAANSRAIGYIAAGSLDDSVKRITMVNDAFAKND